jgi:P27 family predicted phage terminase small subunit
MTRTPVDAKIAALRSELHRRGITPLVVEEDLLRIYAEASEQFDTATSKLAQTSYLAKGPAGTVVISPLVQVRDSAVATIERVGRQLGLSPDHRIPPTLPTWREFAVALHD